MVFILAWTVARPLTAGFRLVALGVIGAEISAFAFLPLSGAEPDARQGLAAAATARPLAGMFGGSEGETFRRAVSGIASLQVFEGLPDSAIEPELFERERARADLMDWGGVKFYARPLAVAPEDAAELRAIFYPGNPFAPGDSGSACGRFHPDYLLVWANGEAVYSAGIGLACEEVEARGPGLNFRRYIPPDLYARLDRVLGKYSANRPVGRR